MTTQRYFFDVKGPDGATIDEDGHLLEDREAVRRAAALALPSLARDELPDGDVAVFSVVVRDEAGHRVHYAALTYINGWLND